MYKFKSLRGHNNELFYEKKNVKLYKWRKVKTISKLLNRNSIKIKCSNNFEIDVEFL